MFPRPYLTQDGVLWVRDVDTPKGRMRVLQHQGVYQSASFLGDRKFEAPFAYLQAFDHVFELSQVNRVLLLGGGGYSWPKQVLAHDRDVILDVVEIEPAFTKAAKRHLFLDEACKLATKAKMHVFHEDGLAYLRRCEERYSAIVNDAFQGDQPAGGLLTDEALALAKEHLAKNGAYFVNVVADEGTEEFEEALHCIGRAFVHTYVIEARDPELSEVDNFLVVGSDVEQPFTEVLQQLVRVL